MSGGGGGGGNNVPQKSLSEYNDAVKSTAATAKSAQAKADATNAALFAQMLGNQKALFDSRATPTPNYYQPPSAQPQQPQFMQIPGFQGMQNPFYTPQMPQQQYAGQNRAQQLTSAYNAYKSNMANQMYNAKVSQMDQQKAQQKAQQDVAKAKAAAEAAAKAKAEAEAAAANPYGSIFGAANGGIADLYRGY